MLKTSPLALYIKMLFISPPFGNYLRLPNTIPINGSFTYEARSGLLLQIMNTLRFSIKHNGWMNKIGLRNKGIDYAIENHRKDEITSIAIIQENEIPAILQKIPDDMNIELNVSCPNVRKGVVSNGIQAFHNPKREWCIIKLSPLTTTSEIDEYYRNGFRQFHCSNTLPIGDKGGLSGPALVPYTTAIVRKIKSRYPDTIVIAGGGIRDIHTVNLYKTMGADHISVSTLCMNPISFGLLYYQLCLYSS
jgi:dihydroorotate dehydrogenase